MLGIETQNAHHVTPIEVLDIKEEYMQRVFATDKIYGMGTQPKFKTVLLLVRTTWKNEIKYNKIWFRKALSFLIIKVKCMMGSNVVQSDPRLTRVKWPNVVTVAKASSMTAWSVPDTQTQNTQTMRGIIIQYVQNVASDTSCVNQGGWRVRGGRS